MFFCKPENSNRPKTEIQTLHPFKNSFPTQTYLPHSFTALLTEDFCGVEPVTLPPIEKETRPPPIVDQDKLRSYDGVSAGFLGSKCRFNVHYRRFRALIASNSF